MKRVLDSNSEWLLGLIVASWDSPKGWTNELRKDLEWLAKLGIGAAPTTTNVLSWSKETTKNIRKARIKTATADAIFMQGTQDVLENFKHFQQEALGSVGLRIGAPQ